MAIGVPHPNLGASLPTLAFLRPSCCLGILLLLLPLGLNSELHLSRLAGAAYWHDQLVHKEHRQRHGLK